MLDSMKGCTAKTSHTRNAGTENPAQRGCNREQAGETSRGRTKLFQRLHGTTFLPGPQESGQQATKPEEQGEMRACLAKCRSRGADNRSKNGLMSEGAALPMPFLATVSRIPKETFQCHWTHGSSSTIVDTGIGLVLDWRGGVFLRAGRLV